MGPKFFGTPEEATYLKSGGSGGFLNDKKLVSRLRDSKCLVLGDLRRLKRKVNGMPMGGGGVYSLLRAALVTQ